MIRDAALILIVGNLILGIVLMYIILIAFTTGSLEAVEASIMGLFIALFIGAVIVFVAVISRLVSGVSTLARYSDRYSTAETLIKLGYIWGIVLLIVGVISIPILIGIFLLVPGIILLFLGGIGLIILMFSLNDEFKEQLFLIAGILFILGFFIPLLDFIGWILVYVGANNVIRRLSRAPLEEAPPPPPEF